MFGGYTSASRVAMVSGVREKRRQTLFYGTYYEGLECSPNCFYFGAVPNQFLTGYVPWILENLGEGASISSDRTTSTPALPRRSFRKTSSRQPAARILADCVLSARLNRVSVRRWLDTQGRSGLLS